MKIDFVTLFPEMVSQALGHSIMARASASGLVSFRQFNPRDHATDKHRTVDDTPYGGGPGMVLMAPLVAAAIAEAGVQQDTAVVLTDPGAPRFDQRAAASLEALTHVVFVCGHYEGIDERVRTTLCTHAYSIGDFVMTGGEIPALAMADAVVRLLPGVIGDPMSHQDDSHADGLLGFPLYTRPQQFNGEEVPSVLLSGNHAEIAKWRRRQQLARTKADRPDLFAKADLGPSDLDLL